MFWKNFVELCEERKISPNAVCEELGLSNATATKWKQGAMPRKATLQLVADYFSVPVDRLFSSEEKEKSPSVSDEDLKFALFGGDKDIPDEVLDEVKRFAAYAKERYGKTNKD